MRCHWTALFLICLLASPLAGQRTTRFTEPYAPLKAGEEWMTLGLNLESDRALTAFLADVRPIQEPLSLQYVELAKLMQAQAGIRSGKPAAERDLLEFAREVSPDPMGNQALLEAADFYFQTREYAEAIHFYEMVNLRGLGEAQRTDAQFRQGYCHFVRKEFGKARPLFGEVRDVHNAYYEPANYYYGMTLFFEGAYDEAIQAFRRVEGSPVYARYMPYIICQILFAQAQYDELIAYASLKLDGTVENAREIHQLLGRAYFEKQQFPEALPHLAYYADRDGPMQAADFYQLGFCQYRAGQYDRALVNLEPLSRTDDQMGQQALFILGDAYLRSGNKVAARNAFWSASKMTFIPELADKARFLYARLSYDLRIDRDAIPALAAIPEASPDFEEAQKLLGDLLSRTGDLDFALEHLENHPLSTPQLKEAFQKVCYRKAVWLRQEGNDEAALPYLKKSLSSPVNPEIRALAIFQLGELYHLAGDYEESIGEMHRFLTLSGTLNDLPENCSVHLANYMQGYNYLKTNNYSRALGYFQETVSGIKKDLGKIRNATIRNNILGDATLRTGDCYFKENRYPEALNFYGEAIRSRFAGFHYARYQSALIVGLQGQPYEKVVQLDQLLKEFPQSDFADDALYEIGTTYMDLGKMKEALDPFRRLVTDYRQTSDLINAAYLKLGLISYNQGDIQEAIRQYKAVLRNNPDAAERRSALEALEEIYVRDLSSPDDYLAILQENGYVVSDASRDSLQFETADNLFVSGAYEKAIDGYSQYIRRFPSGMHLLAAHFRRGESYSFLKRFTEAFKDYEVVIGMGGSRYEETALEKAAVIAYDALQDYGKAFTYYQRLQAVAGNEATRFSAKVGALRAAYRNHQEADVLTLADEVSRDPQAREDQIGQAGFYKGKVYYDRKQFDLALPVFREVLGKLRSELKGEAHYLIADILFKQRNLDACRDWCLQSNQTIPEYEDWVARCVLLLSDVFVEKEDLFNARAALEGLLDNYHGDEGIRTEAKDRLARIGVLESRMNRLVPDKPEGLLDLQEQHED